MKVKGYYDQLFNWLQSYQAVILVKGPSAVSFGLLAVWLIHKITQQQKESNLLITSKTIDRIWRHKVLIPINQN